MEIHTAGWKTDHKPLLRDGMLQQCCLKVGRKRIKYVIREYDSSILYMASAYCIENRRPVFFILTQEPAENIIAFIHNGKPVILHPEAKNDWLNIRYTPEDICAKAEINVNYKVLI